MASPILALMVLTKELHTLVSYHTTCWCKSMPFLGGLSGLADPAASRGVAPHTPLAMASVLGVIP